MKKRVGALLALSVGLTGCFDEQDIVKVGAKNFAESRILAEMFAAVIEEETGDRAAVVDYASTRAILEALKRGDIDVYPEYNGTGLVMVGQNPTPDGDEATRRVKELFEPLGLSWRERVGFANDYAIAMRSARADELGVVTMSDLLTHDGDLTFGIEDDFEERPLDGLQPMLRRYGYEFADTEIVALDDRNELFDMLLDGEVDLIEVFATDGQIADFDLTVLEDDLAFFPRYEVAPLASQAALASHPGLGDALDSLEGRIDASLMRDLNRRVDVQGRAPVAVARDALARLELIGDGAVEAEDPLVIAASAQSAAGGGADEALRAARRAFEGRDIEVATVADPVQTVLDGEARLALVPASAFFDTSSRTPRPIAGLEAVAAIDQSMAHVVTMAGGPATLGEVTTLLTGPDGSPSGQLGAVLADGLDASFKLAAGEDGSVEAMIAALKAGEGDAALIMAPAGDRALKTAFGAERLGLLPIEGWSDGANLVRLPFLREARIAARTYAGQFTAVDSLGAQLVLAGPSDTATDAVGATGPSAVSVTLSPISDAAVTALNANRSLLIDPSLNQAAALAPILPEPPASINPDPGVSIMSLIVVAFLVWIFWLYIRPEYD